MTKLQSLPIRQPTRERRTHSADAHRQTQRHSRRDSDPMGQVFLSQDDEHARRHEDENRQRDQNRQSPVPIGDLKKYGQGTRLRRRTRADHRTPADAVGQPAPQQRSDDARSEKDDDRIVPLSRRSGATGDEVKCQECVQTVKHDRPADRRAAQDAKRPPIVPSAQRRSGRES